MKNFPFVARLAAATALSLAAGSLDPAEGHERELRVRRPLRIPDVAGYCTLRCDFHTHTAFSDGGVWPDVRAEEAWREGLDAIAVTDHIEYLPHRADLPPSHERSWQIAREHGEPLGLLVIRGSEITRKMPPGHLNAIFLRSVAPLDTPSWRDALRLAKEQGAFLFWNHPGYRGQQPDGVVRWYAEHTEILEAGLLHGIEVVSARDYYPEAHRLSLEKDLTPLANSDIHLPVNLDYDVRLGDHRPVTFVFAKERTEAGIREALFARRTVAFSGELLVGREELLRPLIEAALTVENPRLSIPAGKMGFLRIRNDSDLRLSLEGPGSAGGLVLPKELVLAAGGTSLLEVKVPKAVPPGMVRLQLSYTVTNALKAPSTGLSLSFAADVEVPAPAAEIAR